MKLSLGLGFALALQGACGPAPVAPTAPPPTTVPSPVATRGPALQTVPVDATRAADLMRRQPNEPFAEYETRLRDLAARNVIESGPQGRYIEEALRKAREDDEAKGG